MLNLTSDVEYVCTECIFNYCQQNGITLSLPIQEKILDFHRIIERFDRREL